MSLASVIPVIESVRAPLDALAAPLGIARQVVDRPGTATAPIAPGWSTTVSGLHASTVLVSLLDARGEALEIGLRSHSPSGWSKWVDIDESPDEGPDRGAEGVTSARVLGPVWTGRATDQVQVVVWRGSGSALRVEALDTSGSPASRASTFAVRSTAGPTTAKLLSTSAWGSPGWSYRTAGCENGPKVAPLQLAIVHHTVTTNDYSPSETPELIRGIYYSHLARGWCDIAYNFLVDRFGRIWQGRSGPANAPVVGGHAAGFNTGSVGIALLGQHQSNASPPAVSPSSAQIDALATVIAWKFTLHGLDPSSSTYYTARAGSTRFAEGTVVHLARVAGHRDTGSTSCPGDYTYAQLGDLRTRASARWRSPKPFGYGSTGDEALWGDWNGDGRADPAVRRGNKYLMRMSASGGPAQLTVTFGRGTDQAIVGDWDRDGTDTIGVYREGTVYLTSENTPRPTATRTFRYGTSGDEAISGDWDGDGGDGIGVRRGNEWLLRMGASGGPAQISFHFGRATDTAFTGDWDGDGRDTAAVLRGGVAYLSATHSSSPPVAEQPLAGELRSILSGDPTGEGFDMVGSVEGTTWTPWQRMASVR